MRVDIEPGGDDRPPHPSRRRIRLSRRGRNRPCDRRDRRSEPEARRRVSGPDRNAARRQERTGEDSHHLHLRRPKGQAARFARIKATNDKTMLTTITTKTKGVPEMSMASIHSANSAQADYWNGAGGRRWAAHHDRQEELLRPISDRLIAVADPKPGEFVIDIGCGCGGDHARLRHAGRPRGRGSRPRRLRGHAAARPRAAFGGRSRRASSTPTPRSTSRRRARSTSSRRSSASCSSPTRRTPSPICGPA